MPDIRRYWLAATAVLAAAFALRLHGLDAAVLWWDEGLTLFFARLNLLENAEFAVRLADTNPPFYRMLVGGWTALTGSTAFATRAFSVFAGLVVVAATLRIARDWRGPAVALLVGALTAAAPMLIHFSREAKGYAFVSACCLAATLVWLRLLRRYRDPIPGHLYLAYGLLMALALGSHYISIFLIAVQAAWLALVAARARQKTLMVAFAVTLSLVAAVQLPFWLLTYSGTSAAVRGETGEFTGLTGPVEFFATHALEFSVGPGSNSEGTRGNNGIEGNPFSPQTTLWWAGTAALVALAILGTLPSRLKRHRSHFPYLPSSYISPALISSLVLVPIIFGFALNSYHEFFFPRFLLFSVPPLLILAAAGAVRLISSGRFGKLAALALLAVIGSAWAVYLSAHYANRGAGLAEDWRPVASAMRSHVRPGDAAVYARGWMPGYLHAYLPPVPEPDYYLSHYTPETLGPELEHIAAEHSRVWLLDYQIDQFDSRNAAGQWLGHNGALVYAEWFGDSHVALFLLGQAVAPPDNAEEITFTNGLQLRLTPVHVELAPGDALALTLDWTATAPAPQARYTVFLHGLAADGSLAFGRDSEPMNGLQPTDSWAAGQTVTEWRGVLLPPDLPAGTYTLALGLYGTLDSEPVPTDDGQHSVEAGLIEVR